MTLITEARTFVEAAKPAKGTGMLDVVFINEGWGSSGYYGADMLQEAANDKVFPAGTQMFINHPTAVENEERPVRDLNYLAAVLTEDATYDPKIKGLRGPVKTFPAWRESLSEMAPYIGVSIRAAADVEEGEVDGRTGIVVTKITEGLSVDFVTKAGRGGHIVEVLESAMEKGLLAATPPVTLAAEALQSDVREALAATVRKAYGKPFEEGVGGTYVWLRDYDPDASLAYFTVEDGEYKTYQQEYDESFNLVGDRVEVRATTVYVPLAAPTGSPSTTTTESVQEDHMTTLEEAQAQATAAEARAAAAEARAEEAERKLAHEAHTKIATKIVGEAFDALDVSAPKTVASLATRFTLNEDGTVDEEALKTLASEAAAEIAEARGQGAVRGLGHSATATGEDISEADLDAGLARIAGRSIVKEA